MSRYNIENFKLSFSNLENKNMDSEIFDILAGIAKKLNCSIDKNKKKLDNDKYFDTIKNFKATQVKNQIDDENKNLQNIRKILNMITENNYKKFDDEIFNNLKYVKDNFNDKYEKICKEIFKLLSNNFLYSKCYSLIFKNLIEKDDIFRKILDDEISNFDKIFDTLVYISPDENYEKFCEYNKKNENRRSIILFYSNLYLINTIDHEIIYNMSNIIFNKLNEYLNISNKNNEIDEISESNYLFITNIYNYLSKDNLEYSDDIFKKVSDFSNYKVKDFTSLTNKCIFKHMDIIDELS